MGQHLLVSVEKKMVGLSLQRELSGAVGEEGESLAVQVVWLTRHYPG